MMPLNKFELRNIRGNIYQLIDSNQNQSTIFLDKINPVYSETNYKKIKYKHITNLKNVRTRKIHCGGLFEFDINEVLFSYLIDYIKNNLISEETFNYTHLKIIFNSIEQSFKKTSYNRKKLIGLFGELILIKVGLENNIDLTYFYQSQYFETKHDICTDNLLIEVKTTTGSKRNHAFSDLNQINQVLYTLPGYVCSVQIKPDSQGITISNLKKYILENLKTESAKNDFERKVNLLFHGLLENKKKFSLVGKPEFIAFDDIPRPIIDNTVSTVEWTINYKELSSQNIISLIDFLRIYRS